MEQSQNNENWEACQRIDYRAQNSNLKIYNVLNDAHSSFLPLYSYHPDKFEEILKDVSMYIIILMRLPFNLLSM